MIPALVTIELAHAHLGTGSYNDDEVMVKAEQATGIVMNHLEHTEIPSTWFSSTIPDTTQRREGLFVQTTNANNSPATEDYVIVPGYIEAAILLQLGDLFETTGSSPRGISDAVKELLNRRPALG